MYIRVWRRKWPQYRRWNNDVPDTVPQQRMVSPQSNKVIMDTSRISFWLVRGSGRLGKLCPLKFAGTTMPSSDEAGRKHRENYETTSPADGWKIWLQESSWTQAEKTYSCLGWASCVSAFKGQTNHYSFHLWGAVVGRVRSICCIQARSSIHGGCNNANIRKLNYIRHAVELSRTSPQCDRHKNVVWGHPAWIRQTTTWRSGWAAGALSKWMAVLVSRPSPNKNATWFDSAPGGWSWGRMS